MMDCLLAIDQSTSATKAILFDIRGHVVDQAAQEHQQYYPRPGWVEHDAEAIYVNLRQVLQTLLQRRADLVPHIRAVSLTNQRETFVIFDRTTGRPLYRAIVWQCRRGEALCRELEANGYGRRVQEATGLKLDTYFPASKIRWLLDDQPVLRRALEEGQALLGTMDTYLLYRLTRGACFATEHTNACRTLLYNISRLDWDEDLCALFGVPLRALPAVLPSQAVFGQTDLEGLLPHALPLCGVMGDSQAALFAEGCFQPGMAKVTLGTGSSVLLNIGSALRFAQEGIVTTIAWVYRGQPTYAYEGIINYAGATIAWLKDQLHLIADPRETETLARSVPDNGGVYLVPAFVGLSAPYWKPGARAAIIGLSPASSREHVVRAALESIAYQARDVLGLMSAAAGLPLSEVQADGGMVGNRFLLQFLADVTRLQVRAASAGELSALGAVLCGCLGLGIYGSLDELQALEHGFELYRPLMDAAAADAAYAGWQRAVARVL